MKWFSLSGIMNQREEDFVSKELVPGVGLILILLIGLFIANGSGCELPHYMP